MKLIIDAVTGTILNAQDCYLVNDTDIPEDDLSDGEITEIAVRIGKSIQKMGSDTGWGDNSYRHTVSYSPLSVRDEADSLLDGGIYESPEDEKYKRILEWARDAATLDQLMAVSDIAMGYDHVWDGFKDNLMESLVFVYQELHP